MQGDDTVHDQEVGDALGTEGVHGEAAQSEGASIDKCVIVKYPADALPEQYVNFILSAWKRSLREGNEYFKLAKYSAFFDAYNIYLNNILDDDRAVVRMALIDDSRDVALGFSVCRDSILDYVYVTKDNGARRQGIGKLLVPNNIDTITHLTRTGLTIWGNKYPKWTFNPFA